jgi:DNA-binding NtrC family response regulator
MTSVFVPDGVLLDLALPGLPGEVALERFGGLDATVPVIIISDNHDEAVARASLAKGAFDYMTTPFDLARLEIVLAASMAERHRRR